MQGTVWFLYFAFVLGFGLMILFGEKKDKPKGPSESQKLAKTLRETSIKI